ncbi:MAG: thioredoxin domain-containing protein [Candidatus Aenigmatarchaeota archaeon]
MKSKILILLMAIVAIVAVAGCTFLQPTGSAVTSDIDETALAKFLTEKGAVMYGTEWCSHCQTQKALFGDDFKYINFVNCDTQTALCDASGVRGYPTWIINGQKYEGEQTIDRLAQLVGYVQ